MHHKRRPVTAGIALCLCLCGPTFAAEEAPGHRLAVGGYLGAQLYDAQRDLTGEGTVVEPIAAPMLGARATLSVPWLLVELEADLAFLFGRFDDDSGFQAVQGRFEFRYDIGEWAVRPFVAMGPTVVAASTDDFGTDVDAGASAGGGLEWPAREGLVLRTDLRWLLADGVDGSASDWEWSLGAAVPL